MNQELDKKLCEKYPKIFCNRNAPMTQTLMCWGFSCDDGWYNIIDKLCANIQWHIDQNIKTAEYAQQYNTMANAAKNGDWAPFTKYYSSPAYTPKYLEQRKEEVLTSKLRPDTTVQQVVAIQVKEKFGTLRFYANGGDQYTDGLIAMAESMSSITCEICGHPGKIRHSGWLKSLCDEHAVENGYSLTETDSEPNEGDNNE